MRSVRENLSVLALHGHGRRPECKSSLPDYEITPTTPFHPTEYIKLKGKLQNEKKLSETRQ